MESSDENILESKSLLIMRFKNNEVIKFNNNPTISNLGNIGFNQKSILASDLSQLNTNTSNDIINGSNSDSANIIDYSDTRTAYFKPYNESKGFKLTNISKIKDQLNDINKNVTIYFKYKINIQDIENITPIISTKYENNIYPLIYIENKQFFAIKLEINGKYHYNLYTKNIEHTLNNKWHTFCLTRTHGIFRFFIDGLLLSQYEIKNFKPLKELIDDELYIGYCNINDTIYTFNNGYLDDICIFDQIAYKNSFIPPTNYFQGSDVIENYKDGNIAPLLSDFENDVITQIKDIKHHTLSEIDIENQNYNPIKLRFSWYVSNIFYRNGDIDTAINNQNYVVISVSDLSTLFFKTHINANHPKSKTFNLDLSEYNDYISAVQNKDNLESIFYYEEIYEAGMNKKDLLPALIFVNGCCIKLSKVKIVKSQDYYSLLIETDELNEKQVKKLEILAIPFPVIYTEVKLYDNITEGYVEPPLLWSFNHSGTYDINNVKCWYYLKKESSSINNNTDLGYHVVSLLDGRPKLNLPPTNVISYENFIQSNYEKLSNDNKFLKTLGSPNSNLIAYNFQLINKENIDTDSADETYYKLNISSENNQDNYINIIKNYNTIICYKTIKIDDNYNGFNSGTDDNRKYAIFQIPKIEEMKNIDSKYHKFLLFKNNNILCSPKDFEIDLENERIRIKDFNNFLIYNDTLTFLFILTNTPSNIFLYTDPIFISLNKNDIKSEIKELTNDKDVYIDLPNYYNLIYTKNIIFYLIIDGKIIPPNHYNIDSTVTNRLVFINTTLKETLSNENNINNISLCLLQVKNNITDPLTEIDKLIGSNLKSGKRFILRDLGIPKWHSITLNNLICFDQDGKYISDLYGYIYNLNIIKYLYTSNPFERIVTYVTCIYNNKYIPISYNNINNIFNDKLLREYLTLQTEVLNLDDIFYELMNEFDFKPSIHLSNEQNYARILNYIVTYNQGIFNPLFEKRATTRRIQYDTEQLNSNLTGSEGNYTLTIDVSDKPKKPYYIFFEDGKLASWNNSYDLNNSKIINLKSKFKNTAKIESLESININNFLFSINRNENNITSIQSESI